MNSASLSHHGSKKCPVPTAIPALQWILDNGAYPSPGDDNMVSPLQLASLKGHAPVVAALLKAGASVRMADGDGDTALHWASQNDHLEV